MLLIAGALAQVALTGPFTGEFFEGFESFPLTNAALPCITSALGGQAQICAPDANVGGMQIRDELFLGACLLNPFAGGALAGSNDGAIEITFSTPVAKFGARFSTHAATAGNVVIELFDSLGTEIASFSEPVSQCTWDWYGYEVIQGAGIHSVRIRHTLNGGALIDLDDLQIDTQCGPNAADGDSDGAPACVDCDDGDSAVFPGASESCNGNDDDCDGAIDNDPSGAPLALLQAGVCAGELQICIDGSWQEPDYAALPAHEAHETQCDGLDNDCNGAIDDTTQFPAVGPAFGVCLDLHPTCAGTEGWLDPPMADWPALVSWETVEATCDGLDNDCNGAVDDGLEAPLATLQQGVCAGQVQVCGAQAGWLDPDYASVPDYAEQEICDELDNDCDGMIDEDCQRAKSCSMVSPRPWLLPLLQRRR